MKLIQKLRDYGIPALGLLVTALVFAISLAIPARADGDQKCKTSDCTYQGPGGPSKGTCGQADAGGGAPPYCQCVQNGTGNGQYQEACEAKDVIE
jgi:hypothetical protein